MADKNCFSIHCSVIYVISLTGLKIGFYKNEILLFNILDFYLFTDKFLEFEDVYFILAL